ncbi:unnamed protein product [Owenia fusiformis]|uniref:Uncharacterized protein n=1 Tax=Owenia fusiformis TaxID=6347 RepID=A0A8S4MWJ5_OWEFU|nr:unnamed protein product [Owenia fusiformis]
MADDQAKPCPNDKKEQLERRSSKSRLAKQDEVEELEEEDNSPSSEASDATIVPVLNTPGGSPQSGSPQEEEVVAVEEGEEDDDNTSQTHPRVKVLVRSQALRDDSSPPPDSTGETSSSSSTTSISSPVSALTTPQESKGRLEKQGSGSSSLEIYGTSPHCLSPAGGNSPALSRDTSVEMQYTDSTGTDLEEFITMTLNKNLKDRNILLKMECDLNGFVKDQKHDYLKFPPMTSYHRMLVHRVAAFFGLDHNVDTSGKQVVVNKTPNTRIPDYKFLDHIREDFDQPKKLILKRDTGSFDDGHGRSSEKMSLADKRSKSYEEREEEYQKARERIFRTEGSSSSEGMLSLESPMSSRSSTRHSSKEDLQWREHPRAWSSTESSGYGTDTSTKFHKLSVPKASSFGETGMTVLARSDSKGSSRLSKNDSMSSVSSSLGSPMTRPPPIPSSPPLDSSSSSQSAPSPAQQQKTPSPSGHTGGPPINLEPGQQVLCLADVDTLPPGSIIIDPATGQPYRNPDGTVYRHNPTPAQQQQSQQQQPAQPPPPQLASPQGPYCYGANYQPKAPQPVLSPQQSLDPLNNPELTQRLSHMTVSPQGSLTISPQASVDQPEVTPGGQAQQQQMFMVPVQQQQQPTAVYQHPQHPQQSQPTQQQQQVYFPANQQVASGQQQAYAAPQYASQTQSQLPAQGSLEGHPVVQQHPLHLTQQSSTETQLQYNNSQNYPPVHMVQGYTAPQATHGEAYPTPQGFPTHQQPGQPQGYAIRPQAELPAAAYQQYPHVGHQHHSSGQTVMPAGGQQSQPVYYNVTSSTGNTQYVTYQPQPHEQPQAAGFRPQSPTSQQPGMQPPAQSQTYIMGTPQLAQPVTSSCGSQVVAYPSYPGVAQPQQHRAQSPPQQASSMVYSSIPGHPTQGAPRTASPPVNPVNIQYTQAVGGPQVHGYPNPTERPGQLNLREGVVPGAPVSIPHGHVTPVAAHPQPTIRPQLPAVKLRPPTNTTGDVRFVGPSIQPRIPIQPMFQQFPRFPAHMGVISKAPRGRKAWTRLSKESSQSPSTSTESEPSGSVALEVTDVQPHMKRTELEAMLEDLINQGVQLRYQLEDVNKGTSNFSVSDCTCILAIFDSECNAQTALANQSKGLGYTLRPSQRQLLQQEPLS